ncbi:MAG: helix-turn-helix domain-containing protein [Terracidiphilus sp.]
MLFLKPPTNANDIREFCHRFNEGMRVEYKSVFDTNVRGKVAKMISSFANSLGGVAIVGVTAIDGVPQNPIEGFDTPEEELTLVIEQICLSGLNPPLLPKITQIPSDIPGKCLLVIEVDESIEAPHAIENSKKVYVRTGNASNPYELADVDLIIELFTRRRDFLTRRNEMIRLQNNRVQSLFPSGPQQMVVEVSIGPTFPRRAIVDRQGVWDFMETQRYRGGAFLPRESFRRTNDGVMGRSGQLVMGDLTQYGFIFWKAAVESFEGMISATTIWEFGSVLRTILKALVCSNRFYSTTHYRGSLQIDVTLSNCFQQCMPFFDSNEYRPDDFRSIEYTICAQETTSAEILCAQLDVLLNKLMTQISWSFWQSSEPFPTESLARIVSSKVHSMGLL